MAEREATKRLGRGLAALIGDATPASGRDGASGDAARPSGTAGTTQRAAIVDLDPNPRNPRRDFVVEDLEELAASIRTHGLVQPIAVRRKPGDGSRFEIIAGERRWRAAQRAGLHDVPIMVVEASDKQALELAIIENVQRADLNPVEEALGYERLMTEFTYSQGELGDVIGKSRSHVANTLRLLKLPEGVLDLLRGGALSAGHARTLIGHEAAEAIAREIVQKGLSVREAELLQQRRDAAPARPKAKAKDADTRALEKRLEDALGLTVDIRDRGDKGGQIALTYKSLEQLDDICRRLASLPEVM